MSGAETHSKLIPCVRVLTHSLRASPSQPHTTAIVLSKVPTDTIPPSWTHPAGKAEQLCIAKKYVLHLFTECVYTCTHTHTERRENSLGELILSLPCGFQGSNSGHQAGCQTPFPLSHLTGPQDLLRPQVYNDVQGWHLAFHDKSHLGWRGGSSVKSTDSSS